jgi:hypothetical protein
MRGLNGRLTAGSVWTLVDPIPPPTDTIIGTAPDSFSFVVVPYDITLAPTI